MKFATAGLLSKWGFDDGDLLDDLLWDHDFDARNRLAHPLLERIVRERILPALDQEVEVEVIGTIHNPIRAATVDGRDVRYEWHDFEPETRLTPEMVEVDDADILAMARSLSGPPDVTEE